MPVDAPQQLVTLHTVVGPLLFEAGPAPPIQPERQGPTQNMPLQTTARTVIAPKTHPDTHLHTWPAPHPPHPCHSLQPRRGEGNVVGLQKGGDGRHHHRDVPPHLVPAAQEAQMGNCTYRVECPAKRALGGAAGRSPAARPCAALCPRNLRQAAKHGVWAWPRAPTRAKKKLQLAPGAVWVHQAAGDGLSLLPVGVHGVSKEL